MIQFAALSRVLLIGLDERELPATVDFVAGAGAPAVRSLQDYPSAQEALLEGDFDVALINDRVDQRSGIELIREARAHGSRDALIILADQHNPDADREALEAGASDFLVKADLTSALLDRAIRYSVQQARTEEQRLRLLAEQHARGEAESVNIAKDQFLARLSHELRTPLTPALMAISAMQADSSFPQSLREDVQMIRRNIELEARLIDDLLDLTRIIHGKLELRLADLDLHAKLRHVLRMIDSDAQNKGVKVTLETAASHWHSRGDAARLQQVIWNLLNNAIKFTPANGTIAVRTNAELPQKAGGTPVLVIEVRDTGQGIESQLLPRIFNAFEQGQGAAQALQGLGLGLAISKRLADLHGGTLTASSEGRNKGATFTLRLPTIPVPSKSESSATVPAQNHSVRILFVEDHPDTARVLTRMLRRRGFEVRQADSVAAALKAVNEDTFDLLISDIGLPDGTGLDVMKHVQKTHPFPGIAVSGFGMDSDVQAAKRAGFSSHLTKPVLPDVLLNLIAETVRQHHA